MPRFTYSGLLISTVCLAGCAGARSTCALSDERSAIVLRSISDKITEIENDSIGFDIKMALRANGSLMQLQNGECYAYLFPVSKIEGQSILDGDGGIYVDPITLELGEVFWFSY